jgi:chromosome segregation ATPase
VEFTPRDLCIGMAALIAGGSITAAGAYYYHPAALEKKKLELEQEEKKKKELAEKAHQEEQRIAELNQHKAKNVFLTIQHLHKDEIEKIKKDKLQEKDALLTIIKENYGMKELPLNSYYQNLQQHIISLYSLENMLNGQHEQERLQLIATLERVSKTFQLLLSEKAHSEKEHADIHQKKDAAELRKREKEQLEIVKLQMEIDTLKQTRSDLSKVCTTLEGLQKLIVKNNDSAAEIARTLNALQNRQIRDTDDIKKTLAKTNERIDSKFALLFKLFDQARQYVNQLVGQPAMVPQPPATFNPEVYPPAPAPSAPPL